MSAATPIPEDAAPASDPGQTSSAPALDLATAQADALAAAVHAEQPRALADLAELVAFPSVADPAQYDWSHSRAAAAWLVARLHELGVADARVVDTVDGSQTVLGGVPAPAGAPTVLLYGHYDVQPPLDEAAWHTPPFTLTPGEDGRLHGRGAADCKGNLVAHLSALRALRATAGALPVGVRVVFEGSEEQGGQGLDRWLAEHPEDFAADVMLIMDSGNVAAGEPTLTVALRGVGDLTVAVDTVPVALHSGQFGGAAPDALQALIMMLASLRGPAGDLTVPGIPADQRWAGADYPEERFRADAAVPDGAAIIGSGSIADMLWARPTVTVLGVDAPPVVGSTAAIQGHAAARLNLRVPPGMSAAAAQRALADRLRAVAPWGVRVTITDGGSGEGFAADTMTRTSRMLQAAMARAFGRPVVFAGSGGAIPLTNALQQRFPDAEIALFGVEDPAAAIHAPNESVLPAEIEAVALSEALFLAALGETARID